MVNFRNKEIIYTACLIQIKPYDSTEEKYSANLKKFKVDRFLTPECSFSISGFNKPAKGNCVIPLLENFTDFELNNFKENKVKLADVQQFEDRRDALHSYFLNAKWIPIEIYFIEKQDAPLDYDEIYKINLDPKKQSLNNNIQAYKMFDGLGFQPELKFDNKGHYIHMEFADRMILLENYILNGKFVNANSTMILQAICKETGLELHINGGISFKNNMFKSNNQARNEMSLNPEQFKLLNKNIGENSYKLLDRPLEDSFLINAKKSLDVVVELAKMESSIFYIRGKKLYFGGIDKSNFQHLVYTWRKDIIALDIQFLMNKPIKDDPDNFPYYIQLLSWDAVNGKEIKVERGSAPKFRKKGKKNLNSDINIPSLDQKGVNDVMDLMDANANGGTNAGNKKQADESAKTIFVYQKVLGLSEIQLIRLADAIETAILHGALKATVEVPLDYSITPFDTMSFRNIGKELGDYIFNVEEVSYKFSTATGINQSLKLTTGHDNVFNGPPSVKNLKNGGKGGYGNAIGLPPLTQRGIDDVTDQMDKNANGGSDDDVLF